MDEMGFLWLGDYVAGRLTKHELQELRRWLDEEEGRVEEFARWVELVRAGRGMRRSVGMEGEDAVWGRKGEGEAGDRGCMEVDVERGWERWRGRCAERRREGRMRWWVSVAAGVVLAAGVGLMGWIGGGEWEGEDVAEVREVLPGRGQAVLVLGDGRRVDLSGVEGQEVRERGVRVESGGEGGLEYDRGEVDGETAVFHRVEVPMGGEYHFWMEDGTRVWVNSESEVGFPLPFGADRREIYVKGEVYLEVASDTTRPFVVHADGVSVRVLGTRFNVEAYGGERGVVTTLAEGKVEVERGEERMVLVPDEQAVAVEGRGMVKRRVDSRVVVSWMNGVFEFEEMSLAEIAERLERWYGVDFRFEEAGLRGRRFTGVFGRNGSLNSMLEVMGRTTDVAFEVGEREVRVTRKSK